MRQSGILLNGITRSSRVSPLQSPKHPMDHANKRAQSSTIAGSATVPGCPGIVRSASPRPSVSGPKSRDPITYNANKPLERAGTSARVDVGAARAGRSAPSRWADLGELGLCRSRLQRRRMLRLVDAEFPAAWQRKPRDRAPALLVDGRALHVLLLHLGDERLHVVAH